jgi:hypothetical protein
MVEIRPFKGKVQELLMSGLIEGTTLLSATTTVAPRRLRVPKPHP